MMTDRFIANECIIPTLEHANDKISLATFAIHKSSATHGKREAGVSCS